MLVPLSWLRDYVDIDLPVDKVAELLTNAGLEVKHIIKIGVEGADLEWDREKIVLAKLADCRTTSRTPSVWCLATVDYGAEEPKTVVTGAPNLLSFCGRG